jgi:serine/threonine protein kinase
MANQWYYARGGKQFGPFSWDQLAQLAQEQNIRPDDHVWGGGFKEWLMARAVPGLLSAEMLQALDVGMLGEVAEVALDLSGLALKGVCEAIELGMIAGVVEGAVKLVARHFLDQSERLPRALNKSNERAWRILELALAGETILDKVREKISRAEDRAFLNKIREFLKQAELPGVPDSEKFRKQCLQELRKARASGKLELRTLPAEQLARKTVDFARFKEPKKLIEAEWALLNTLVEHLKTDYPNLALLLVQRPQDGPPLLVMAARYYFRREVEEDGQLFQGMVFSQLEGISQAQQETFDWMVRNGDRVAGALDEIQRALEDLQKGVGAVDNRLKDVQKTGAEAAAGVLRIEEELLRQGPQYQQMYQVLQELRTKLEMKGERLRSGASFSIRDEKERHEVKEFLRRYRSVAPEDRRARPALQNAVAQLEVAAGEFEAAEKTFQEVASTVMLDRSAQAEIHHNRYLSFLEKHDWEKALQALLQCAQLVPERFNPFLLQKYRPKRILGAGGFGVAFLCENLYTGADVVIKTLRSDATGVDVKQMLREGRLLASVRHPAIVQVYDCDYADTEQKRAFLVMEYFESQTLGELVSRPGAVAVETFLPLAIQIAEGLLAAHERGILHRDIKPANILVRRSGTGWDIRLIDFGLALAQDINLANASTFRKSNTDSGLIAGTQDYAAPEQMGRLPHVKVGAYSDIYGFGKTCCYALFQTPQPILRHFESVPKALARLLADCLEEEPSRRPQSFQEVVRRLREVPTSGLPCVQPVGTPGGKKATQPLEPLLEVLPVARKRVEDLPAAQPVTPPSGKGPPKIPQWFFCQNGKQRGPVPEPDLLAMVDNGQLTPADLVWKLGMDTWVNAGSLTSLFPQAKRPSAAKPAPGPVLPALFHPQPSASPAAAPAELPKAVPLVEDKTEITEPVNVSVRLEGIGGSDPHEGVLDFFLDKKLIGTGSAILGVALDITSTVGPHEIRIRGRYLNSTPGAPNLPEEKSPICFSFNLKKPGRYVIGLSYGQGSGVFKRPTGATPPNKIDIKRVG